MFSAVELRELIVEILKSAGAPMSRVQIVDQVLARSPGTQAVVTNHQLSILLRYREVKQVGNRFAMAGTSFESEREREHRLQSALLDLIGETRRAFSYKEIVIALRSVDPQVTETLVRRQAHRLADRNQLFFVNPRNLISRETRDAALKLIEQHARTVPEADVDVFREMLRNEGVPYDHYELGRELDALVRRNRLVELSEGVYKRGPKKKHKKTPEKKTSEPPTSCPKCKKPITEPVCVQENGVSKWMCGACWTVYERRLGLANTSVRAISTPMGGQRSGHR